MERRLLRALRPNSALEAARQTAFRSGQSMEGLSRSPITIDFPALFIRRPASLPQLVPNWLMAVHRAERVWDAITENRSSHAQDLPRHSARRASRANTRTDVRRRSGDRLSCLPDRVVEGELWSGEASHAAKTQVERRQFLEHQAHRPVIGHDAPSTCIMSSPIAVRGFNEPRRCTEPRPSEPNGLGNKGFYPVFLFALERLLSLTSDGHV